MDKPQFNIGDRVFVAWAYAYAEHRVPCPICFGKLFVTLILGNGEHQTIECDACGGGSYEGPRGTVNEYRVESGVDDTAVEGVTRDPFGHGWRYETACRRSDGDLFATLQEAEARRVEKHAAAEAMRLANFEAQFKGTKRKGAWTVRYHREQIEDCERKIAWHRNRLAESARTREEAGE